jgi:hypothetical protein
MTLTYGVEPKSFMETQQFPCLCFYKSTLSLTKVLGNELIELHLQMPTTEHMTRELAVYVSKAMNTTGFVWIWLDHDTKHEYAISVMQKSFINLCLQQSMF